MPRTPRKQHFARWVDSNGEQRKKAFHTRREALDFKRRVEVAKADGVNIDNRARRTRIDRWCRATLDRRAGSLDDITVKRYDGIIRNQLDGTDLAALTVGTLRRSDVETWVHDLAAAGLAPRTVKKAFDFLSSCLTAAVYDGAVTVNPCKGVRLPRAAKTEMRWLTPDEVERAASAIDQRAEAAGFYSAVVLFLAFTGLRFGEMARLRVGDVDVVNGRVRVARKAKSDAGFRDVPVAQRISGVVRGRIAGRGVGEVVFTTPRGAPLNQSKFHKKFKAALVAAGLDPEVRVHDLRHSCATWLIEAGEDPLVVARWLGHASPRTTMDIYAHLFPDKLDAAALALDGLAGTGTDGAVVRLDDHRKDQA